jgi:alpha-galactosidase
MKGFGTVVAFIGCFFAVSALVFFPGAARIEALDNGLALTPPMGWNSWNTFGCDVDEQLIRDMADAMVASGMKDAGYQYVVIDDCWQVDRDGEGNIVADPERFPSGMKALADYMHSKGLKFGLYSDAGTATCQGRPGSRGYEFQDARRYAAWGVDYLKYDWCNHGKQNVEASYSIMRDALAKSGRPIVFSICEWGQNEPWLWGKDVGHLWRTTGDITDCWDCQGRYVRGVTQILDQQVDLWQYAGPGHWNDPDMLEVGNEGLTLTESKSHFSLWCILAAPLMAGNDLRSMSPEVVEILTNREVIAVNQDPQGSQGYKHRDYGDTEIWKKPLAGGATAIVLLNRSASEKEISVRVDPEVMVRDLWEKKDLGRFETGWFTAPVASHGVVMIRAQP